MDDEQEQSISNSGDELITIKSEPLEVEVTLCDNNTSVENSDQQQVENYLVDAGLEDDDEIAMKQEPMDIKVEVCDGGTSMEQNSDEMTEGVIEDVEMNTRANRPMVANDSISEIYQKLLDINPLSRKRKHIHESFILKALTLKKRVCNKKPLIQIRKGSASDVRFDVKSSKFAKHKWMVIGDRGAVCLYCKLFLTAHDAPNKIGKFVTKPWLNYSRSKDIDEHETNTYHRKSATRASNFLSSTLGQANNIIEEMDGHRSKDLELSSLRLDSIIRALVVCARHGLSLQTPSESVPLRPVATGSSLIRGETNRGSFIQLLTFARDSGDKNIDKIINKSKYTSPAVQGELLGLLGDHILSRVINEVNSSTCYSVIAEETNDASNTELLCITVRFFNEDKYKAEEKFVAFVAMKSLPGESLGKELLTVLGRMELPIGNCVGLAYSGTSGNHKGVSTYISSRHPKIVYTHRKAYQLNIALMDACYDIPAIRSMMNTLNELCDFFCQSPKRQEKLGLVIAASDLLAFQITDIYSLSITRWVERYNALECTLNLLPYIATAIQEMIDDWDYRRDGIQCEALKSAIMSPSFIYSLVVCSSVMNSTTELSQKLKGENVDFITANVLIRSTGEALANFRNNVNHLSNFWYTGACQLAENLNTEIIIPRRCGKRTAHSNVQAVSANVYFCQNVAIPFLNLLNAEFQSRFRYSDIFNVFSILPTAVVDSRFSMVKVITELQASLKAYECIIDLKSLPTELCAWRTLWLKNKETATDDIGASVKFAKSHDLSAIAEVLMLLAVLPLTSSETEKAYSKFDLLNTDLSNMDQNILNSLALLAIHRDRDIHVDEVIGQFLKGKPI